jgi:hypothetical protein
MITYGDTPVGKYAYLCAALTIVLFTAALASAQSYTYKTVDVPFTGANGTHLNGLTDLGTMSGTYFDANWEERSWLYRRNKGIFETVKQSGKNLIVLDVNPSARVTGEYFDGTTYRGFTKKESTFTPITVPGADVRDCALNTIGYITCTAQNAFGWHGLIYSVDLKKIVKTIDVPGALGTSALGINNANNVVGAFDDPTGRGRRTRGFRWVGDVDTGGVFTAYDAPCGGGTVVQDINDAGLMAVVCHDMPYEGSLISYAFDGTTWTELVVPDTYVTVVTRVNNAGQFAGWYMGLDGKDHGFVATPMVETVAAQ